MDAPFATASAATGPARPAESAPVLELVLARVRLRALRRAAWLAHVHGGPADRSARPPVAGLAAALEGRDAPDAEAAWYGEAKAVQPLNFELERVERALAGDIGARLRELRRMFRLSEPEMDLLQTCLALALEPGLGTAFGHLQQSPARGYVTEPLAARLFGHGRRLLCEAGCPLMGWGLVRAGEGTAAEPAPCTADPVVLAWLQGELRMDPQLMGLSQVVEPREPLANWPVAATAHAVHRVVERGSAARVLLVGPPGSGRRTFAAVVARQFGIAALAIDTGEATDADWDDTFMRAQRLAVLGNLALVWRGSQVHRSWPGHVAPAPIQFVAIDLDQFVSPCEHAIDQRIDMPSPSLDERRRLWRAAIPESAAWPAREMDRLVTRYQLNVGEIAAVARRIPASARDAAEMARELTRHRLGDALGVDQVGAGHVEADVGAAVV